MADYIYEGRTKCGCFGAAVVDNSDYRQGTADCVIHMLHHGMIVQRIERAQLDLNDCAEHKQPIPFEADERAKPR